MLKFLGRNEWYISPELYPFHKPLDVDNVGAYFGYKMGLWTQQEPKKATFYAIFVGI